MENVVLNNKNIKDEITEYIVSILENEFQIKLDLNKNKKLNFFHHEIGLFEIEMVYLYFLCEDRYNIKFTEEEIDSSSFYSLNGLKDSIINHININK